MEFKSRTALTQHIKELEKSGYLTSSWQIEHIQKDGKPFTKGTRIFKVNFQNITTKETNGDLK
jgi:hypothetical protein